MKKLIFSIGLCAVLSAGAQTFTEFYMIGSGGGNTNAGSTTGAPVFAAQSGYWTNATGTFFKSGLNPVAGGVTNGAWAAVYPNGNQIAAFIGIVTNCDDTADTISLSQTQAGGTNPGNDTSGATSIVVGGAWYGPNTNNVYAANGGVQTNGFPFPILVGTMTNNSQNPPRFNIKGGTTYFVTNAISAGGAGSFKIQGYTTTPGDGGKAHLDGGTVYPTYVLITISGAKVNVADMEFSNNGAIGNSVGVSVTIGPNIFRNCVFHDFGRSGLVLSGNSQEAIGCEAYYCNKANSANECGFKGSGAATQFLYCTSHDNNNNSGANASGIIIASGGTVRHCLIYGNSGVGLLFNAASSHAIAENNVIYNNAGNGIDMNTATFNAALILNNLIFKSGAYGINSSGSALRDGLILNNYFGSGTYANSTGDIASAVTNGPQNTVTLSGVYSYTANQTPWVDPANANFTESSSSSLLTKAAGWTGFTGNTVSYPDIGASQAASTNSAAAAGGGSYTFAQ